MKKLILCALLALGLAAPAQAVTDKTFPGGWYVVACPNGDYGALITKSRVETNTVPLALPGNQDTLYLTSPCDGTGRLFGVGHVDDHGWEWQGGIWNSRGLAFGVNPGIYNALAGLTLVHGPGPTGSQGYRYLDTATGALVTGDSTYSDPVNHLWEYTIHGDIRCGQGADEDPGSGGGGVQCLIRGRRVLVEAGVNRAIRFFRQTISGVDLLALAWVRQDSRPSQARIKWLTYAELDALPTYHYQPTTPVDPVDPIDPIEPVEPPAQLPNELETVRRVASQNRHLLEPYVSENRGIFVQKVLAELGPEWGHVAKTAPEGQYTPPGFEPRMIDGHRITGFAEDAIFHKGANLQVDIALGTSNGGEWVWWGVIDPIHYRSNNPWMLRVPLDGSTDPVDPVEPPTGELEIRIAILEAQVAQLKAEAVGCVSGAAQCSADLIGMTQARDALAREVAELKARPATCRLEGPGIFRFLYSCRVN